MMANKRDNRRRQRRQSSSTSSEENSQAQKSTKKSTKSDATRFGVPSKSATMKTTSGNLQVPEETSQENVDSGAPAARTAAKRSPILIKERKGNPWVDFLMVIMASGIARGRVRTTATATESRNMAAILQIIGWQRYAALVYGVLPWYWTSEF